jgi:hypothetical protein
MELILEHCVRPLALWLLEKTFSPLRVEWPTSFPKAYLNLLFV